MTFNIDFRGLRALPCGASFRDAVVLCRDGWGIILEMLINDEWCLEGILNALYNCDAGLKAMI
jgi:hypothetical protein